MESSNVIQITKPMQNCDIHDPQVILARTAANINRLDRLTTEERKTIKALLDGCGIPYASERLANLNNQQFLAKIQDELM